MTASLLLPREHGCAHVGHGLFGAASAIHGRAIVRRSSMPLRRSRSTRTRDFLTADNLEAVLGQPATGEEHLSATPQAQRATGSILPTLVGTSTSDVVRSPGGHVVTGSRKSHRWSPRGVSRRCQRVPGPARSGVPRRRPGLGDSLRLLLGLSNRAMPVGYRSHSGRRPTSLSSMCGRTSERWG